MRRGLDHRVLHFPAQHLREHALLLFHLVQQGTALVELVDERTFRGDGVFGTARLRRQQHVAGGLRLCARTRFRSLPAAAGFAGVAVRIGATPASGGCCLWTTCCTVCARTLPGSRRSTACDITSAELHVAGRDGRSASSVISSRPFSSMRPVSASPAEPTAEA